MLKRSFDITLASAGLFLLSPLMIAVALLVKLDSEGPVLFRQRRVGRGLQCFTLFKFRTMVPVHSGDEITVADDRRITRLGHLLRLAKLDELPQLWNILAGDMSFVGPRPLVESTVNRYRDDFQWILAESRPGVTDPASIKYRHESAILGACPEPLDYYFRVIMPDKIRMQKAYLRRQSVLGDMKILWQTLAACCRLEQVPVAAKDFAAADIRRTRTLRVRPQTVEESTLPEFPVYFTERAEARSWEMDAR